MANSVRSFSLSAEVQLDLSRLNEGPGALLVRSHLPPFNLAGTPDEAQPATLDASGLSLEDYPKLCAVAGVPPTAIRNVKTLESFRAAVGAVLAPSNVEVFNRAVRDAKSANRRTVEAYSKQLRATVISQSGLVNALLALGIATLRERAAQSEVSGGRKEGNAGKVAHKSTNPKARRTAAA